MPPMNDKEKKALGLLGLAARARYTVAGAELICTALKNGKRAPLAVVLACDASQNTQKRLTDRTAFYGVPCLTTAIGGEALALAIGKRDAVISAVGITDQSLAEAVMQALS